MVTKNSFGQSLFEVVVAVGVIALVMVAVLSLGTTSVRNSNFAKNGAIATKYAQEGTEYARQARDSDWALFFAQATGLAIPAGNISVWPPSGTCYIGTTIFCRTITLTQVPANEVDVLVLVQWTDSQGTHSVRNATSLTKWR